MKTFLPRVLSYFRSGGVVFLSSDVSSSGRGG